MKNPHRKELVKLYKEALRIKANYSSFTPAEFVEYVHYALQRADKEADGRDELSYGDPPFGGTGCED